MLYITQQLIIQYQNRYGDEEAEVSGDDEEIEEVDTKNCGNLDDFIEDDDEEEEDIEKEDDLKTILDQQNEFIYLKSVFELLYTQNSAFYTKIFNTFSEQQKNYLFDVFQKTETIVNLYIKLEK